MFDELAKSISKILEIDETIQQNKKVAFRMKTD